METVPKRPWYQKKRYLVPLGVASLVTIALASDTATPVSAPAVNTVAVYQAVVPEPAVQMPVAPSQAAPKPIAPKAQEPQLSNDNYYTNVDGNSVHSPAYAPSVPAGASARCRDGTYSFSQHRSGTCSHHGGVADWL